MTSTDAPTPPTPPTGPKQATARKGALVVVFLTVLIDLLGFGMIVPLLQTYARDLHASGIAIGWLTAIFSLMQFVFAPLWGRVSDRVGRKPILLLGLFGSCGSYVLFALSHSLPMLFASRIFAGIFGATISTAQAYVADVTTPETRARGMGMIGAAFGIGFVFGPAIAAALLYFFGQSAPGWFAAGLSLSAFLFGLSRLTESHHPGDPSARRRVSVEAAGDALRDPRLSILVIAFFVLTACFAAFETTFMNLGRIVLRYDTVQMAFLLSGAGLCSALVQGGLIHRLVKAFGERKLLVVGPLLLGLGFLFVAFSASAAPFLAAALLVGLAYGICNPPLTSLLSKNAPANRQGELMGVAQSGASLGRVLGPLGAGVAWDHIAERAPYRIAGVILLVLAVVFALYRRRFPNDRESVNSAPA